MRPSATASAGASPNTWSTSIVAPASEPTPLRPSSRASRRSTSWHRTCDKSADERSQPGNAMCSSPCAAEVAARQRTGFETSTQELRQAEVGIVDDGSRRTSRRAMCSVQVQCRWRGSRSASRGARSIPRSRSPRGRTARARRRTIASRRTTRPHDARRRCARLPLRRLRSRGRRARNSPADARAPG